MTQPKPNTMDDLDNLRQIWEYYHHNRQIGHTTAMLDGANKVPCILLVADNMQRKNLMRSVQPHVELVTVTEAKMGKLRGTKKPLLIEHYALTRMFSELLALITAKLEEVDRAARLQENELLNIDELPMAIGNKVLERRVKLKASLKGGDV